MISGASQGAVIIHVDVVQRHMAFLCLLKLPVDICLKGPVKPMVVNAVFDKKNEGNDPANPRLADEQENDFERQGFMGTGPGT